MLTCVAAHADPQAFIDFAGGTLAGWSTQGTTTFLTTTDSIDIQGDLFTLTPAPGHGMARILPQEVAQGTPDSLLGLSDGALQGLLGSAVTNFAFITRTFDLTAGTYSFAWSYAANDYVPFNDGVFFSVVGTGTQSVVSLARNGLGGADVSGPSPDTLVARQLRHDAVADDQLRHHHRWHLPARFLRVQLGRHPSRSGPLPQRHRRGQLHGHPAAGWRRRAGNGVRQLRRQRHQQRVRSLEHGLCATDAAVRRRHPAIHPPTRRPRRAPCSTPAAATSTAMATRSTTAARSTASAASPKAAAARCNYRRPMPTPVPRRSPRAHWHCRARAASLRRAA